MKKKILIGLLVIFALIQFIRPARNESTTPGDRDITIKYKVPENVLAILKVSCYDCHSNNTNYPWHTNIQPFGWWMQGHINDGKRHLNFSEFSGYQEKKAKHKFEEIEESVRDHWMPLPSYLWIHSEAKLTDEQSKVIMEWAGSLK